MERILTYLCRDSVFEERDEASRLAFVREVEIHSIPENLNAQTATMSAVLENQLFQVKKRTLMGYALTNLNQGFPRALPVFRLTFDALLISDDEHDSKGLLKDCASLNFFLNC